MNQLGESVMMASPSSGGRFSGMVSQQYWINYGMGTKSRLKQYESHISLNQFQGYLLRGSY